MQIYNNLTKFIVTAFVKNVKEYDKEWIIVELETILRPFREFYPKTDFWLQFKKGQTVQLKVIKTGETWHTPFIFPTFFDFPSRCKKCGRFYKVYCKKCYQDFKWIYMILDRFAEESKEKIEKIMEKEHLNSKTVSNWEQIKHNYPKSDLEYCDPALAGPPEEK